MNVHVFSLSLPFRRLHAGYRAGVSHFYRNFIVFEMFRVQNVFYSHFSAYPGFSNFSDLKNVFGKLRLRRWRVCVHEKPNRRNSAAF